MVAVKALTPTLSSPPPPHPPPVWLFFLTSSSQPVIFLSVFPLPHLSPLSLHHHFHYSNLVLYCTGTAWVSPPEVRSCIRLPETGRFTPVAQLKNILEENKRYGSHILKHCCMTSCLMRGGCVCIQDHQKECLCSIHAGLSTTTTIIVHIIHSIFSEGSFTDHNIITRSPSKVQWGPLLQIQTNWWPKRFWQTLYD